MKVDQEMLTAIGQEKLGLTLRPLLTEKATPRQLQIEPLTSFDWENTAPLKFRPFKPIYFITMGRCSASV